MFDITEDITYIGCDDTDLDLFEGQYAVPHGVSYNSYVIRDKEIAVLDTVDGRKTDEWLGNLQAVLGNSAPDYIIVSHVEPDHSASLPAFIKRYPAVKVVGNAKTFEFISKFYGDIARNKITVTNGDKLNLGKHSLQFIFAPMVHWPEVTVSYDSYSKILFSADGFGKFGALSYAQDDWTDEARRYYINIVGKYGAPTAALLNKAAALEISAICPLHGPVLTENLDYCINKYKTWSSYAPECDGVFIAYASVYGHTAAAAKKLYKMLCDAGVKAELADLARCDMSGAVANAFKYSRAVFASITYDGGIMPCMQTYLNKLKSKNYCNRKVGIIQNGSWAPMAAKCIKEMLSDCKNIAFCGEVTLNSALGEQSQEQLQTLAAALGACPEV